MDKRVDGLEHVCKELLAKIKEELSGNVEYGLEEWFSKLRTFKDEENLNAQIAYDQTRYPAEISIRLMKQAQLRGMSLEDRFRYIGRLNSKMKELLSLYPNINNAAKRLEQ